MTDLEDLLRAELGEVADLQRGPRVDTLGVRRAASLERRRRGWIGAGAVAATVALVAGLSLVLPRTTADRVAPADRLEQLPLGAPLRLAWADQTGLVHLPDGTTPQVADLVDLISRGGTTVIATGPGGQAPVTYSLVEDDGRLTELTRSSTYSVRISPDGQSMSWVERAAGGAVVRSYDRLTDNSQRARDRRPSGILRTAPAIGVDAGDELADVVAVDGGAIEVVMGRSPLGVTIGAGSLLMLGPSEVATPITGLPDDGSGYLIGASTYLHHDDDGRSSLYSLSDRGAATLIGPIPSLASGFNATGTRYIRFDGSARQFVSLDLPSGSTRLGEPLPLPSDDGEDWAEVGWESATDAVFIDQAHQDGDKLLVRCSTTTNACEQVPSKGIFRTAGY